MFADISHASLLEISNGLNRKMLAVLNETLHIGSRSNFEPESLWRVSNSARDGAIRTLIDLHQRLEVRKQIPKPVSGVRRGPQIPHPSDRLRVSHPPPPRTDLMPTRELARHRPEELALVPYGTANTHFYCSSIDSQPSSPLSARSSFYRADHQLEMSSTQPVSARFRESISPALADPIIGGANRKTAADLLQEWKADMERNLHSTTSWQPSPTGPQPSQILGSDQIPNAAWQSIIRHASAPPTPVFNQRSYNSLYESQPLCATATPSTPTAPRPQSQRASTSFSVRSYTPIHESNPIHATSTTSAASPIPSRPGFQYNQGMVGGGRHRSDSYVPSVMGTPRTPGSTDPTSPMTVQSVFTHNRQDNSAKASADEIFSRGP
jgi:hypothetical protein